MAAYQFLVILKNWKINGLGTVDSLAPTENYNQSNYMDLITSDNVCDEEYGMNHIHQYSLYLSLI